jgi:hypothetical protein
MAAIDNLKEAIEGISANWPIIGKFVSGGPTDTVKTGSGETPVIAKMVQDATAALDQAKTDLIAQKDVEINQLANGVLLRSVSAADASTAKASEALHAADSASGYAAAAQHAADSLAVTGGAEPFQTLALLSAVIPANQKQLAYVNNDPTAANNGLYSWYGTAWVKSAYDPLTRSRAYTDAESASRTALLASNAIDTIIDKYGFGILGFLSERIKAYVPLDAAQMISSDNKFLILDQDGFGYDLLASLKALDAFGFLSERIKAYMPLDAAQMISSDNKFLILDQNGFGYDVLASLKAIDALKGPSAQRVAVDVSLPLITPKIAFWAAKQLSLDVSSLMRDRASQSLNQYVLASFVSEYAEYCIDATRTLTFPPTQAINGTAYLFLRDKIDQRTRSRSPLTIVAAPDAVGVETINLHCIGDSIVEMGGAPLAKRMLVDHGYTVNMIGTYLSGSVSYKGSVCGAELCEGRGGWMAKDLTHRDTARLPITSVADYKALSNADKKEFNPYIRPATGADNPADVNNGYIFDFADYLRKFGLTTPNVVYLGMGTNDINKRSLNDFTTNFALDIATVIRQIKAAAPATKIVLGLPSTSMTPQRNALWPTYYFTGIRALIAAASTFGVSIAPTWLACSGEVEYVWATTSTDPVTGTQLGNYEETDLLHPYAGSRFALYDLVSATLVAAFKNLI